MLLIIRNVKINVENQLVFELVEKSGRINVYINVSMNVRAANVGKRLGSNGVVTPRRS